MTRFLGILCLALIAESSADEIRIVRNGKAQTDRPGPTLVTNVIRFLALRLHPIHHLRGQDELLG
jgi:hypothetical protein